MKRILFAVIGILIAMGVVFVLLSRSAVSPTDLGVSETPRMSG